MLVLVGFAVLPWLGDLFEAIELPGGAKFKYRQLEQRLELTEQRAEQAQSAVGSASYQARIAMITSGSDSIEAASGSSEAERVNWLANEFTRLRQELPHSSERTYRQDKIFAQMIKVAPRMVNFDIDSRLHSENPGTRLTAYARLYARPEPGLLSDLVNTAIDEKLDFSQYWAFQAVAAVVEACGAGEVPSGVILKLRSSSQTQTDSERSSVLQGVLARFQDSAN